MLNQIMKKPYGTINRFANTLVSKRNFNLNLSQPIISFSFDDFPQSASTVGLELLKKYEAKATFYIAFGLIGKETATGKIADIKDIKRVIYSGNYLGCHTFNHLGVFEQKLPEFEDSIKKNNDFLQDKLSQKKFTVFSYPKGQVKPGAKKITEKYFKCSRGIIPGVNKGTIDLNLLKGTRVYGSIQNFDWSKNFIDQNIEQKGWLIFYTHDISNSPTQFGCTPELFEEVLKYSKAIGALMLSVNEVCNMLEIPETT